MDKIVLDAKGGAHVSFNRMVEYTIDPNLVFGSLSDPTRRDILQRLVAGRLSVSEIAVAYDMSLAAISKHVKVLEQAGMVRKKRQGKHIFIELLPNSLTAVEEYLQSYTQQLRDGWQQ